MILVFLSTPSARRATVDFLRFLRRVGISIHALREEGDNAEDDTKNRVCNFYPRPPRGGRRAAAVTALQYEEFLSTPSARRATPRSNPRCGGCPISIHALREEGDCCPPSRCCSHCYFYPRPPRGGRPPVIPFFRPSMIFLSTPSARRATDDFSVGTALVAISIHALREEGDQQS